MVSAKVVELELEVSAGVARSPSTVERSASGVGDREWGGGARPLPLSTVPCSGVSSDSDPPAPGG